VRGPSYTSRSHPRGLSNSIGSFAGYSCLVIFASVAPTLERPQEGTHIKELVDGERRAERAIVVDGAPAAIHTQDDVSRLQVSHHASLRPCPGHRPSNSGVELPPPY
jgi:hypothetical protein